MCKMNLWTESTKHKLIEHKQTSPVQPTLYNHIATLLLQYSWMQSEYSLLGLYLDMKVVLTFFLGDGPQFAVLDFQAAYQLKQW